MNAQSKAHGRLLTSTSTSTSPWICVWLLAWAVALGACGDDAERTTERTRSPSARERLEPRPGFAPVTDTLLAGDDAAGADWPVWGGAYNNRRYSALDQIDRRNVSRLAPVWVYQTGVSESFEATPLVVDGTMYLTTAESHVIALNAATGDELWHFVPDLDEASLCCGPNNRGVAVFGERVFVGTLDAHLIALDRRTGEVAWDTQVADPDEGYSITMAPLAYDGRVVIGVSGGEYGIRGFVAAYGAESGEREWRFHTIPAPGDAPNGWWGEWAETTPFGTPLNRDILAEKEDSADNREAWERGGGGVWMTPAYSPRTNTLYVTVGDPSPDLGGSVRPGDNLYTGSIVALDAGSGELEWYFQYLPHDRWNLGGGGPPILVELDGRSYVAHAAKTGWLYLVDAEQGRPVLRSENFVPQQNLFAPPSADGTPMAPGPNGGNASPPAFSPRTGLAYVLASHQPALYTRRFTPYQEGRPWLGGTIAFLPEEEQWGTLSAIDLHTGEIRWQHRTPSPSIAPSLVTAGNVLFVGQATGTLDAFDAENGDLLWRFRTGAGVHGGPVSYMIGGTQYVAVAAGGHYHLDTPRGDDVFVFALTDEQAGPAPDLYPQARYRRDEPQRYRAVRQVPAEDVRPPGQASPAGQEPAADAPADTANGATPR